MKPRVALFLATVVLLAVVLCLGWVLRTAQGLAALGFCRAEPTRAWVCTANGQQRTVELEGAVKATTRVWAELAQDCFRYCEPGDPTWVELKTEVRVEVGGVERCTALRSAPGDLAGAACVTIDVWPLDDVVRVDDEWCDDRPRVLPR